MSSALSQFVFVMLLLYSSAGPASLNALAARSNPPAAPTDPVALDTLPAAAPGIHFVHVATPDNTSGDTTFLHFPLITGDPGAVLIVTQNWNPGGAPSGVYNNQKVGVSYVSLQGYWGIYNESGGDMPVGAAFNVFIPATGPNAFLHTTTANNVLSNWTTLDHALTNNNPSALLFTTHKFEFGPKGYEFHDHSLGVWYNASVGKWAIFNQDFISMDQELDFNIWVASAGAVTFVHTASAANSAGNSTYLDHPLTNGRPNAIATVTQNWNPGGIGGTYNDKVVGVWYDPTQKKWAVFNQDGSAMPVGAAFNILLDQAKMYLPLVLQ